MNYLNLARLDSLDGDDFQSQHPFPWINPEGVLTDAGHRRLVETLPDVSMFKKSFGYRRKHGQQPHDRFALEYSDGLPVAEAWQEFIAELRGPEYHDFVCRMLGIRRFDLNCHWHYATAGCSVSPHLDSARKYGSQVFYFNTTEDWDPDWGGQTVVLSDKQRRRRKANPEFEDLESVATSQAIGNYSLLFARGAHSWHGVRALNCPEGRMRKIFIVVINRLTPLLRLRRLVGGLPGGLSSAPQSWKP
ncbi:MAG: hypothetical protein IIA76_09355 [Proteobacteria bacterium]|nr:hypothetical protein [Pseudomonadota bacterium]MCH7893322.1 hypothetical protein [Pseudomonadota bacterium]MCH8221528.1 hypothetical protein [Pseudomonadota bacterium]